MTQHIVTLKKPAGMAIKQFKGIVSQIEAKRPLLTYTEKQQCQEFLKLAGIRQGINGGSLNFNVAELLKSELNNLSPLGIEVTELHMKINALPVFLDLVLHNDLYSLSQKEVAKNERLIRSKGYMDCKDDPSFWQKKIWDAAGEVCRVILISKGIGEKTNKFFRCEAWFKKGQDMPIEEKQPVFSQYLADLVV